MIDGWGVPVRWMVTGAGGALGRELVARLTPPDAPPADWASGGVVAVTRAELDVTDPAAVRDAVHAWRGPG